MNWIFRVFLALGVVWVSLVSVQAQDIDALRAALLENPEDAGLLCKIGDYYVQAGLADSAEQVYERALKLNRNMPEAFVGLGRVFLDLKHRPRRAASHLRNAVAADSTSAYANALLARAYFDGDDIDRAEASASRALRLQPGYAPAYLVLAQVHQRKKNTEAALAYYQQFIDAEQEDHTPALAFVLDFLKARQFDRVEHLAARMKGQSALPLLAQVRQQWGDYEGAFAMFESYVSSLPEEEQAVYYDISRVSDAREAGAYETVATENREAFLRAFWLRKDPFKTSGGTMRRVEHYRRVWYARTFFGKRTFPWDRRGDVYIRYGEPDYKSNWREVNAKVPLKVQRVQEKIAFQLYGRRGLDVNYIGPVFPVRTERDDPDQNRPVDDPGFVEVGLLGWKPITVGNTWAAVPWEVWIYTEVDDGMEVAFTDEFNSGNFNYAPVPTLTLSEVLQVHDRGTPLTFMQRMTDFSPARRVAAVASKEPDRFDISHLQPFDFYYDPLAFRGENGKTELQIDIGLPINSVSLPAQAPDTTVVIERRIALLTERQQEAARFRNDVAIPMNSATRGKGLMARDRVRLEIDPGKYELAMQMWQVDTDVLGVYRQALELDDFSGEGLMLSDLQVAQRIYEADEGADPRFVRGKWAMVTTPSRTFFAGDPVFVYFEIYNLSRDAFGATRYEVAFSVGASETAQLTQARIRKQDGESVAVQYEQVGTESVISDYVELNVGQMRAGRYVLHMTVKDLNSGQTATRRGVFRVVRR